LIHIANTAQYQQLKIYQHATSIAEYYRKDRSETSIAIYQYAPYVADISIDGQPFLGHTPALGCGGLADKDAIIYMTPVTIQNNYHHYI
jgi:hypothetical protein